MITDTKLKSVTQAISWLGPRMHTYQGWATFEGFCLLTTYSNAAGIPQLSIKSQLIVHHASIKRDL